jgi:N-acetyl-gamma-glutamyl-phosphate reductase
MLKVAVIGATGYTGEELVRILAGHPHVRLAYVSSREDRAQKIQDIFPYLRGRVDLDCRPFRPEDALGAADVFFLSLPHTVSMRTAPALLANGKRVIDVSADYRLPDPALYERHYGEKHADPERLREAVYGLPEFFRDRIRNARLVANPGCYPTSALLGLLPLARAGLAWQGACVIDAKSGVTGAGRKASAALNFSEVNENFRAYKVLAHQHEPEIAEGLKRAGGKGAFVFVTHLLPLDRGILSTLYFQFPPGTPEKRLRDVFESAYAKERFVRVHAAGRFPGVKDVLRTNQCHIGLALREETGNAVVVSAIDNLGKGAAGQAVQNMNLACGFPEEAGLE